MPVMSRSTYPAGLLFAMALVAGLEFTVFRPRSDLATFISASWVEALRASRNDAVSADVLFLGDSQIKGGLLPATFEKKTRIRAYNLATIGGQPAAALALLERAVEAGAKPRAVGVGFYPGLLASDGRINVRQWPEVLGTAACLGFIRHSGDLAFAAPLLVRSLLPSLRRRDEIRSAVVASLTGKTDPGTVKRLAFQRNWRLNSGAQALAANPAFQDDPVSPVGEPGSAANRAGAHWSAKDEHRVHLRNLLAYTESRAIDVFWLLPTNSPGLRRSRISNGLETAYLRFVTSLQREFPSLTILDPSALLNDSSQYHDACHLNRDGALALSVSVADTMNRGLNRENMNGHPRSQRVILARGELGKPSADDIPEDINQSTRIICAEPIENKIWR